MNPGADFHRFFAYGPGNQAITLFPVGAIPDINNADSRVAQFLLELCFGYPGDVLHLFDGFDTVVTSKCEYQGEKDTYLYC